MRVPILIVAGIATSACGSRIGDDSGAYCTDDLDCSEVCTRLNECVLAEEVVEVRLSWTINNAAPTPAAPAPCGGINHFEVRFNPASARDEPAAYAPVPCSLGQTLYDRMPSRFVQIQLTALDSQGVTLDVQTEAIEPGSNTLLFDFQL